MTVAVICTVLATVFLVVFLLAGVVYLATDRIAHRTMASVVLLCVAGVAASNAAVTITERKRINAYVNTRDGAHYAVEETLPKIESLMTENERIKLTLATRGNNTIIIRTNHITTIKKN